MTPAEAVEYLFLAIGDAVARCACTDEQRAAGHLPTCYVLALEDAVFTVRAEMEETS